MAKKAKSTEPEPLGAPVDEEASAEVPASPSKPGLQAFSRGEGLVLCTVTHGSYQDDRLYESGEQVYVAESELAALAHCLEPVKK